MNESIILTFCISILLLIILNIKQFNVNSKLKEDLIESNKKVKDKEREVESRGSIFQIEPGDKAIIPNYGLQYGSDDDNTKVSFKVTFEVDILEVSLEKVKVKATDFTSTDKIAKDPKNRTGIIDFMNEKWVNRSSIELIVDNSKRRSDKLNQLLND